MEIFTKKDLIKKLLDIKARGWICNARRGNSGGVGNTLAWHPNSIQLSEVSVVIQKASFTILAIKMHNESALYAET